MTEVRVFPDLASAAEAAAEAVFGPVVAALASGRTARVVLSGGRTPRGSLAVLARRLVEERIPAHRLLWLFGDERWVPAGHERSNEGMARAALLDPIGAPRETVGSWGAGDGRPVDCAARYLLWTAMAREAGDGSAEVAMLGLGADGHAASLFPGADAHLPGGVTTAVGPDLPGDAAAVYLPREREWRLTLCPAFLRSARRVVFLVAGREKAPALRRVLDGDQSLPGAWIRAGQTMFFVTQDAAGPGIMDLRGDARLA